MNKTLNLNDIAIQESPELIDIIMGPGNFNRFPHSRGSDNLSRFILCIFRTIENLIMTEGFSVESFQTIKSRFGMIGISVLSEWSIYGLSDAKTHYYLGSLLDLASNRINPAQIFSNSLPYVYQVEKSIIDTIRESNLERLIINKEDIS